MSKVVVKGSWHLAPLNLPLNLVLLQGVAATIRAKNSHMTIFATKYCHTSSHITFVMS